MKTPGPDAQTIITGSSGEASVTGRLSRRRLLSAAAASVTAWACDALRRAGAGAASPGRSFVRSVINVQEHGAKGDGKHNDGPVLNEIIRASREGDALYFPAGTYLVSESLLPKPGQLFFSLSDRTTIKVKALSGGPAFPIFVVRSGPAEFRRLIINGSKDTTPEPKDPADAAGICGQLGPDGMIVLSMSACRIEHAHGDGIRIAGGSESRRRLQRVMVRDTVVEDCGLNGLTFGRINNIRVMACRFERCNNGIKMHGCVNVLAQRVRATANRRHGIGFTFSRRWRVDHCMASANGSGAHGGWGIVAGGEGEDVPKDLVPNSDFAITDNICVANRKGGITLDPTMPAKSGEKEVIWPQRAKVTGNVCRKALRYHGIHITHASNVLVTDNVCANNNRGSGIQLVDSALVRVQRNTCHDNNIGIGEFVDGCVEPRGHNVISNNKLYNNTFWVRRKKTDECSR
jgi:parallel beta-helix repeat protein